MATARKRFGAGLLAGCATVLALASAAWACTVHGYSAIEQLAVTPSATQSSLSCAEANMTFITGCQVTASGRFSEWNNIGPQSTPGLLPNDDIVRVEYWYPSNNDLLPGHGTKETVTMVCHNSEDNAANGEVTYANGLVNMRYPNATSSGAFMFDFLLPAHPAVPGDTVQQNHPKPVVFCAYASGTGIDNSATSEPVVLVY